MLFSFEVPISYIRKFDKVNDYHFILAHMLQRDKDYAKFYKYSSKYKILDNISNQCTEFCKYLLTKGYNAKEYFMEYETAVWENRNLIVPSVGFVGNSWFKALIYLGNWKLLASPYLDMGVVWEDGSRNEKDFFWHIVHAVAMCNKEDDYQ